MPCNCDHMEPTEREKESGRVAKYIVAIHRQRDITTDPWIVEASRTEYGNPNSAHELTAMLCKLLKDLTAQDYKSIILDRLPTSKTARDILTWWEAHQHADKVRIAHEARVEESKRHTQSGLAKLNAAEKRALGLGGK